MFRVLGYTGRSQHPGWSQDSVRRSHHSYRRTQDSGGFKRRCHAQVFSRRGRARRCHAGSHGEKTHGCKARGCKSKVEFTLRGLARHHRNVHGEREHGCKARGCESKVKFTRKGLAEHKTKVHGERKHSGKARGCKGKVELTLRGLAEHQAKMHGEKTLGCKAPRCETKFSTADNLAKHMKQTHPFFGQDIPLSARLNAHSTGKNKRKWDQMFLGTVPAVCPGR